MQFYMGNPTVAEFPPKMKTRDTGGSPIFQPDINQSQPDFCERNLNLDLKKYINQLKILFVWIFPPDT